MNLEEQIKANYDGIMAKIDGGKAPEKAKPVTSPTPKKKDASGEPAPSEANSKKATYPNLEQITAKMIAHPELVPQIEEDNHLNKFSPALLNELLFTPLDDACSESADKEDYNKAVNCMEASLYYANTLADRLLSLSKFHDILAKKKLAKVKGSTYSVEGLLGSLQDGLSELRTLKEKTRGSVGGLLGNLVALALFLSAVGMLWFFPPIHSWMMSYLPTVFIIIASLVCIITFFSSGSFGAAAAVLIAFALLATGYTQLIPEHLQYPIGIYGTKILVSLALLIFAWLLLNDSLRRNWRAAAHHAELNASKLQYRRLYELLSKHISTMEARVSEAEKQIRTRDDSFNQILSLGESMSMSKETFISHSKECAAVAAAYYRKARSELQSLGTL